MRRPSQQVATQSAGCRGRSRPRVSSASARRRVKKTPLTRPSMFDDSDTQRFELSGSTARNLAFSTAITLPFCLVSGWEADCATPGKTGIDLRDGIAVCCGCFLAGSLSRQPSFRWASAPVLSTGKNRSKSLSGRSKFACPRGRSEWKGRR